jgi:hypothetical protein
MSAASAIDGKTLGGESLQQQQLVCGDQRQADDLEVVKKYDRLVDSPAARKQLEKDAQHMIRIEAIFVGEPRDITDEKGTWRSEVAQMLGTRQRG